MSKATLALLVGGLVPAVCFGLSGVLQKTSARAGISTGPFLAVVGATVLLAGLVVTVFDGGSAITREGATHAVGFGLLWAGAVGCIALALGRYDANITQLVPLYNLNTLVAVAVGLAVLGEWRAVDLWRVLAGAVLVVGGGVLVATASR